MIEIKARRTNYSKKSKNNALSSVYDYALEIDNDTYSQYLIYESPTRNCQMMSFAAFDSVLNKLCRSFMTHNLISTRYLSDYTTQDKENFVKYIEDYLSFIKQNLISKNMIFLDITESTYETYRFLFDELELITNTPYVSTSQSNMRLLLINVREYAVNENNIFKFVKNE